MIIKRICPICHKTYKADTKRLKWGRQTTCSRNCSYVFRFNDKKIQCQCAVCGKFFKRSPSRIKSPNVFCSPKCKAQGMSLSLCNPMRLGTGQLSLIEVKINGIWRRFLRKTLDRINRPKSYNTITVCGYSAQQLKNHLEKLFQLGMTWDNYGRAGWYIDHIRPLSSFDINIDIKIVNALENLQPLWYDDNIRKGAAYA